MNTEPINVCPECGKPVPVESQHQVCPACLMAQALTSRTITGGEENAGAVPPLPPEEIAGRFPQFEILECLGRGGMGVVYKARQKSLNRFVALKLLAPERVRDAKFAGRFAREAQALAAMNHPHIVTIHDFGETGGLYYLVMEFVDGVNLRDLLREGKLEPKQALAIVPPVCEALQYAHDQGIVHRDIKPENLLLDKSGRVKVADFGIAKMMGTADVDASLGVPSSGGPDRMKPELQTALTGKQIIGTPGYSAPEQKTDPQRVDSRADIYSLGVVLYEMLTGELPGKKIEAPSMKVQIDVRLDEIVLRALEKKPELRYQQVSEVKTMVETIASTPGRRRGDETHLSPAESQSLLTSSPTGVEHRFSPKALFGAVIGCGVLGLLALLIAISMKSQLKNPPAQAVIETLPATKDGNPGRTTWRWRGSIPAEHALLFTVVIYSSNGVPTVSEKLSSYCLVGSINEFKFDFEMSRQDGIWLSPELRDSYRWDRRSQRSTASGVEWSEFLPVWTQKLQSEGGTVVHGNNRFVIHTGETNTEAITFQNTPAASKSKFMEIQISLHPLPGGGRVGNNYTITQGTDWLESAGAVSKQMHRKDDMVAIAPVTIPEEVTFGPVMERSLDDNGLSGGTIYCDLDDGRHIIESGETALEHVRADGCDLVLRNGGDHLQGIDLMGLPVTNDDWDKLAASEATRRLDDNRATLTDLATRQYPATFLIRTREGAAGLLQITSFTDYPRGVKIRYKQVQD